jgi:hypothetical protein
MEKEIDIDTDMGTDTDTHMDRDRPWTEGNLRSPTNHVGMSIKCFFSSHPKRRFKNIAEANKLRRDEQNIFLLKKPQKARNYVAIMKNYFGMSVEINVFHTA